MPCCSTYSQDLTAQQEALLDLGVQEDRIYTDHGLSESKRDRSGLEQAQAAQDLKLNALFDIMLDGSLKKGNSQ